MYYQKIMSASNLSTNIDDISIIDLYKSLWENKKKILLISIISSLIFLLYAASLKDIYESKALLASSNSSSSNSSLNRFAGVASLAGFNLPSDSESNKLLIGLERLKSIDFFKMVMDKHDLYYEIMAVTSWDMDTNSFSVNEDIYNVSNNKWISDDIFSVNGKPSIQQAHSVFMKNFSVSYDGKGIFVSLAMKHYSPHVAKNILEVFIKEINEITREEDVSTSIDIIEYLKEENLKTRNIDLKTGIDSLIQAQIEKIAIANSTPEYLFKVISPPYSPENRSEPNRLIIVLIGFILGSIFSSMFFIITKIYISNTANKQRI